MLGPLFYIIYANDLIDTIKYCKVGLYADDTVLYTANKNFDLSVSCMQHDINSISNWCNENGIFINTDKTKIMVLGSNNALSKLPNFDVKLGNVQLKHVSAYKYLGVTIDCQLNYNLHVNKIIACVTSKLKQFYRMRSFLSVKAALLVYKSMLLPILEYGDIFLYATTVRNRKRLQVLQNRGLRCALGLQMDTSTDELHAEANLLKLKYRRELHLLNFMYGAAKVEGNLRKGTAGAVVTRSQKKRTLMIKRPKSEKFKKSLAYVGPKKWNALPLDLHQAEDKRTYRRLASNWINKKALANSGLVSDDS